MAKEAITAYTGAVTSTPVEPVFEIGDHTGGLLYLTFTGWPASGTFSGSIQDADPDGNLASFAVPGSDAGGFTGTFPASGSGPYVEAFAFSALPSTRYGLAISISTGTATLSAVFVGA